MNNKYVKFSKKIIKILLNFHYLFICMWFYIFFYNAYTNGKLSLFLSTKIVNPT